MSPHTGIDISSNNIHPIDWPLLYATLKAMGGGAEPFVIVKATQGTFYVNPDFTGDVAGARAAGFKAVGAYLMDQGNDPVGSEEALYRRVAGSLPQFDDDELPTGDSAVAYAVHCSQLLAQAPAMPYYNQSQENTGVFPTGNGAWEANYNNTPGIVHGPNVKLHQYTSVGHVAGIAGNVDVNAWVGTEVDFDAMFQLATPPNVGPPPIPAPTVFVIPGGDMPDVGFIAELPIGPDGRGWGVYDGGINSDPGSASLSPAIPFANFKGATPWCDDPVHDSDKDSPNIGVQNRGSWVFVRASGAAPGDTAVAYITYATP